MQIGAPAAMATATVLVALALCSALIMAALIYLTTGKRIRWMFRKPNPRAEALSVLCSGLGGWIVCGTIVIGWARSHPLLILAAGAPAFWVLLGLNVFFMRKSRRPVR